MLTLAAASTLLISLLASASPISVPASIANGLQITKPTASAIQFRRSHVNNHTTNGHIVRKDMERIRQKYGEQSRRASLIAPNTGGAPPSKRDVTQTPKPFDIKAKRDGLSRAVPMTAEHYNNGVDSSYYGTISIGTSDPSQQTTVQFDTGSSDLVVPLTDCWYCTEPLFDPDESTTYHSDETPFRIAYEDGSRAEGYIASDTVTLDGLTVTHQTFGAVYAAVGFDGPYAGVLGLGFPAKAASGSNTFFGNLVASGILHSNVFSFYMAKDGSMASELCLGCVNPEYVDGDINSINYHPIVKFTEGGEPLDWDIECTGISFPGSSWKSEPLRASIDSGTSHIYVPEQVAKELYDQIPDSHPAAGDWDTGSYAFPCDSVGAVIFEFGEKEYMIYQWNLIAGREDECSDQCVGAIFGDDKYDGTAVFGISFVQNLYSVFDYGQRAIGFANIR